MTTIKSVEPVDAKQWVDNGEAIIVDVRDPVEYEEVHIEGAVLIPVTHIDIDKLPELAGKKLVVHCKFGKRGGQACEKLLTSNPALEVYNMEGGITAWENAGFNVKKG